MLLSYSPIQAAAAGAPTRTVQEAVKRVMKILADLDWQKSDRSQEQKRLVVETISDVIHYDEMAVRAPAGVEAAFLAGDDRFRIASAFRSAATNLHIIDADTHRLSPSD